MPKELSFLLAEMAPLDLPLRQLPSGSPQWKQAFRRAPADSLEKLIETALEQAVDALVLTGHLISQHPTRYSLHHLQQALDVLQEEGIEAFYLVAPNANQQDFRQLQRLQGLTLLFEGESLLLGGHTPYRLANGGRIQDNAEPIPQLRIHQTAEILPPSNKQNLLQVCTQQKNGTEQAEHRVSLGPSLLRQAPVNTTDGQGATLLQWTEDSWTSCWIPTATVQRVCTTLNLDRMESLEQLQELMELELLEWAELPPEAVRLVKWNLHVSDPQKHAELLTVKDTLVQKLSRIDPQQLHSIEVQSQFSELAEDLEHNVVARLMTLSVDQLKALMAQEVLPLDAIEELASQSTSEQQTTCERALELLHEVFQSHPQLNQRSSEAA